MKSSSVARRLAAALVATSTSLGAQAAPAAPAAPSPQAASTVDPIVQRIQRLGADSSRVEALAQALLDSIGPRLTGSPGMTRASEWAIAQYRSWGIAARTERYGTWRGWRRGPTHVDLVAPRVRSLNATMLAWSPGTSGPAEGEVVTLPVVDDSAGFARWLPSVRGRFVLVDAAEPSCRADESLREHATSATVERIQAERRSSQAEWAERLRNAGAGDLGGALERAGARGVLTTTWSGGWGTTRIFGATRSQNARVARIPALDVSCEDYGLLFRLAERGQRPVIRARAEAEDLGEVPVFNTLAEIRGREKPDEYVLLSAHFDTWDGASGATDNGTGTVMMMEAMRLLRLAYPNPRRTILVGHWSGEEQGINGSRAFAADHPEIVRGLQAVFNQDNGTGRVVHVNAGGLLDAGAALERWVRKLPSELASELRLSVPGVPSTGGSDDAAFACHGAPAFGLGSLGYDYGPYTWHTTLDTYDKLVFDDVRRNAVLVATLAYLASEEPELIGRERRAALMDRRTGQPAAWPSCTEPARSSERYLP